MMGLTCRLCGASLSAESIAVAACQRCGMQVSGRQDSPTEAPDANPTPYVATPATGYKWVGWLTGLGIAISLGIPLSMELPLQKLVKEAVVAAISRAKPADPAPKSELNEVVQAVPPPAAPPPRRAIILSPHQVTVRGPLDEKNVSRIIRSHLDEMGKCYDPELDKSLAPLELVSLQFTLDGSGRVISSALESESYGSAIVDNCLLQTPRRWVFPKPKGGGSVSVAFSFYFQMGGSR